MTPFAIVLITIGILFLGYLVLLRRVIQKDGNHGPFFRIEPPRSHPRDLFDPALRFWPDAPAASPRVWQQIS